MKAPFSPHDLCTKGATADSEMPSIILLQLSSVLYFIPAEESKKKRNWKVRFNPKIPLVYDMHCILLPGILLIDGAYDTQGDASHGEEHSHDSLCSSVRRKGKKSHFKRNQISKEKEGDTWA